jgi:transposase
MILKKRDLRVFVYNKPIDMRGGFERLSYYVREDMGSELFKGHLYLFLGQNRKRAKALLFDGTGLVLIHKRLEQGCFMSVEELCGIPEITASELGLILGGTQLRLPLSKRKYRQKK